MVDERRHLNEEWWMRKMREGERGFTCRCFSSHVSMLVKRRTSGEVNKVEHGVRIRRSGRLLVCPLEIVSGSVHGEGELGAGVGERE